MPWQYDNGQTIATGRREIWIEPDGETWWLLTGEKVVAGHVETTMRKIRYVPPPPTSGNTQAPAGGIIELTYDGSDPNG